MSCRALSRSCAEEAAEGDTQGGIRGFENKNKKTNKYTKSSSFHGGISAALSRDLSHLRPRSTVQTPVRHSLAHPVGRSASLCSGSPPVCTLCLWDAACVVLFVYSSCWPLCVSQSHCTDGPRVGSPGCGVDILTCASACLAGFVLNIRQNDVRHTCAHHCDRYCWCWWMNRVHAALKARDLYSYLGSGNQVCFCLLRL